MVVILYSKAIELKNDEPWFYQERGWAHIVLGQYRDAANDYTKVIALNPHRGNFFARRGFAYLRLNEHDKAMADYAKVLELKPDYSGDGWSHYCATQLGAALRKNGDAFAARVEKLVRDFPDEPRYAEELAYTHGEIAANFIRTRRFRDAEKFYGEAIKLKPNDDMLWLRRAEFYGRLGLWDLAAKDSREAFKLRPALTPYQLFAHALLNVYAGDLASYRQLCAFLPKRCRQDVDYGGAENGLSRACTIAPATEADLAWAVQRAEKGVKSHPNGPWNHAALRRAHYRAGAYELAIKDYQQSLDVKWCSGGLTYPVVAMAHHRLGQTEDAKEALEKARQAVDGGLDVLSGGPAGTLPLLWGDWLECCVLYREAQTLIDGAPPADDPRWHLARTHAFAALGDQKKALDSYAKAVQLGATAEQRSRFFKGYLDLAWSLIHANPRRLDEAEKLCREGITMAEQLLARFPDAPAERWQLADLHSALAWTFQHGRQPAAAVKAFQEEVDLREKLAGKFGSKKEQRWHLCRAYTFLGIAQSSAGHLKEAEKAHRQALEATEQLAADFPKEAPYQERVALCHVNLGFVLLRTAQLDEAERHFQQGVRTYEGHPEWKDEQGLLAQSLFGLAQILSKKGRNEEAAKTYRLFLELQPASPMGNNNAAWFLATCPDPKFQDPGRAVKLAQKATELAPMEGTYWNTLGAAHYRAGNWKDAIAGLEKSMELRKGGDSFDWFFLAIAHWHLGEKEKARTWFDQAVQWMDKNQPADEELRRFRSEAAELLGIKDGKK
jgi:tetratricopeptide (TPR) repeat protein